MNRLQHRIILGFILSLISLIALHPLAENQYSPTADEGYYYQYANIISREGPAAFAPLIIWHANDDEGRKYPTPGRVGYILPTALIFKIFGPSFSALGSFSFLCFLLFLAISFHFCRKHFDFDTAILLVLLLSSSPLILGMSRRALSDSMLNLMWGLTAWLFLDFLKNPQKMKYPDSTLKCNTG